MLTFYAPFIQFIAAIYFSMCFEQLIEKFFWNRQHMEEMKKVMQKIEQTFGLTDKDNQEITDALNSKHDDFITLVKNFSIVMLFILVGILFLSGIEQTFSINVSSTIATIISIVISVPIIVLFTQGWRKTKKYVKKINNIIDKEIAVFYQDTQDSITGNTDNDHYNKILAQVYKNMMEGDIINKTNILSEIMQKFKEESVCKIKKIICKTQN